MHLALSPNPPTVIVGYLRLYQPSLGVGTARHFQTARRRALACGLSFSCFAYLGIAAGSVDHGWSKTSSYTIHTSGGFIARIGPMRIKGKTGGTLARATAAFGRPSRIDPVGDGTDACHVEWRRLRLRTTFANFGIDSACSPSGGRLQTATVRSSRFRTTRGVRVGSKSSTIVGKHSRAEFINGSLVDCQRWVAVWDRG
jgi:hypothetical protein